MTILAEQVRSTIEETTANTPAAKHVAAYHLYCAEQMERLAENLSHLDLGKIAQAMIRDGSEIVHINLDSLITRDLNQIDFPDLNFHHKMDVADFFDGVEATETFKNFRRTCEEQGFHAVLQFPKIKHLTSTEWECCNLYVHDRITYEWGPVLTVSVPPISSPERRIERRHMECGVSSLTRSTWQGWPANKTLFTYNRTILKTEPFANLVQEEFLPSTPVSNVAMVPSSNAGTLNL